MFIILTKSKYNKIINELKVLNNHQEIMWNKSHNWANETEERLYELEKIPFKQLHERICKLEKIVENQPLIKKYQKTLDIFLKNAQD